MSRRGGKRTALQQVEAGAQVSHLLVPSVPVHALWVLVDFGE